MLMRSRIRRQIGTLLSTTAPSESTAKTLGALLPKIPSEFNPRQYAILLLDIAASIEHALMVEYLYAAHSLGGPYVSLSRKAEVAEWREIILGIANEEMGHLMTVQNLLRYLGGPLSLDREDYPWDSEFYPFPFRLEPLTRQSLAKYVYTESPEPELFQGPEANEIRQLAEQNGGGRDVHRVGALYSQIEKLLENEKLIPDVAFRGGTFPFQPTGTSGDAAIRAAREVVRRGAEAGNARSSNFAGHFSYAGA
jgi:hypothetical protein